MAGKKTARNTKKHPRPRDREEAGMTADAIHRREMFCRAYLAHGTDAKAAAEAGFTGTNATLKKTGYDLRQEPGVRKRIDRLRRDAIARAGASVDLVWGNLVRAASANITDVVDDNWCPKNASAIDVDVQEAIASVEIEEKTFGSGEDAMTITTRKVKMIDKMGATEKLGKLLGLFKDEQGKMELSPEEFIAVLEAARGRATEAG